MKDNHSIDHNRELFGLRLLVTTIQEWTETKKGAYLKRASKKFSCKPLEPNLLIRWFPDRSSQHFEIMKYYIIDDQYELFYNY